MANINLSTGSKDNTGGAVNTGNFFLFFVLIVVLLTYGGLVIWGNKLDKQIADIKSEYSANVAIFSGQNAKDLIDYQTRLNMAKDLLGKGVNNVDYLIRLERALIPGVVMKSYRFDDTKNTVDISCTADNYAIVAKQILSLKSKNEFASVTTGKSNYNETDKKFVFDITLKTK